MRVLTKIGSFHDAWNVVFNLTATDGVGDGIRSVTGRLVAAVTAGVPFVGVLVGYGRTVVSEFELTLLDEVIKGGK